MTTSKTKLTAAVRASYRQDRPESRVQTYVLLDADTAKTAGFRAGSRVNATVTGKSISIVADSEGSFKLGKASPGSAYRLRLRTSQLLGRSTASKEARVTRATKGSLTIAL